MNNKPCKSLTLMGTLLESATFAILFHFPSQLVVVGGSTL